MSSSTSSLSALLRQYNVHTPDRVRAKSAPRGIGRPSCHLLHLLSIIKNSQSQLRSRPHTAAHLAKTSGWAVITLAGAKSSRLRGMGPGNFARKSTRVPRICGICCRPRSCGECVMGRG